MGAHREASLELARRSDVFADLVERHGPMRIPARTPAKATGTGRKLGKVPPKYRNPAKRSETWTGRGKQPRWLAELVKKGKKPEDFLIRKK